jgi:D-alanyl-D-alanine dipeptidase
MINALRKAGELAVQKGYYLQVTSGYRSLQSQLTAACGAIKQNHGEKLGAEIAWPGGSMHGAGLAVDIMLYNPKQGTVLVSSGNCANQHAGNRQDSRTLDQIMTEAGFERYKAETWHYEIQGSQPHCRCKYPDCPFPDSDKFCKYGCGGR